MDPFALHEDGTAKDPAAFIKALKDDSEKLNAIQADQEVSQIILGSSEADGHMAFQDLLRSIYKEELARAERRKQRMSERTIDAQRASAPVPRDTVQLYEQLRKAGLQYGPAFRLLRNVHVPDTIKS